MKTIADEIHELSDRARAIVTKAMDEERDMSASEEREFRQAQAELQRLEAKQTSRHRAGNLLAELNTLTAKAGGTPGGYISTGQSLGEALVRSEAFAVFKSHLGHGRPVAMQPIEVKVGTPYLPPAGSYPAVTIAPPPAGPLAPWGAATVASLFPQLPASGGSVAYLRDVRTGLETPLPATGTAPGAIKPETPLAPTLIEAALVTLATWSKVANTVPEDVDGFSAWINSVLAAGVADAESAYIVATILGTSGILTSPAGGASVADALLNAAMLVQTRSHLPATGAILAPDTFAALATAKASTSGTYLSGLPLSAAPSMTLWGQLQLVVSAAMAAGTALVVASRAGAIYRKGGLRLDISDSNEDDFLKNLLTTRIEERAAFAVYRAVGFANVTGLVGA